MKRGIAVIGSAFGDEGKGTMTDYHSYKNGGDKACVVRFNGGAQAGHTVVTPEGVRHVFHHFGSGSFNGSPTFLAKEFIVNPISFRAEWEELVAKGVTPVVYVDPRCRITTPYDMLINQVAEEQRENRHGSCGLGINETIVRHDTIPFTVSSIKFSYKGENRASLLRCIRDKYVGQRLEELQIKLPKQWESILESDQMLKNFMFDVDFFLDRVTIGLPDVDTFIFEGAQGLMLDEDSRFFPHVTRSKTGLDNVIDLCEMLDIKDLDVSYMTRTYTTRHGAGELPFELTEKPYDGIEDLTNVPNKWQDSIRYSYLNLDLLKEFIGNDYSKNAKRGTVALYPSITLTCVDQMIHDNKGYISNGVLSFERSFTNFNKIVSDHIGLPVKYWGQGGKRTSMNQVWFPTI